MFDISKVESVYSGRKGCACGCRGKYSYASAYKDQRPGYVRDRSDDEDVSDRSVKMICHRVEKLLRDGSEVEKVIVDKGGDYLAVDMDHDRTYTIYFAEPKIEMSACGYIKDGKVVWLQQPSH